MQPIEKFGLTKVVICMTLHTAFRYGPRSLGCIGIFDPFAIQGTNRIAFFIEQYWKSTPSRPLIWANLSTIQLEVGRGEIISEKNYKETQQWLQTESWIIEVWKSMSAKNINISHIVTEVSTQHRYGA